jgi:hypothetical protein
LFLKCIPEPAVIWLEACPTEMIDRVFLSCIPYPGVIGICKQNE